MSGKQTNILHWDFETCSAVDLEEVGMENYVRHSTTKPILCAWAMNESAVSVWQCQRESMPDKLLTALRDETIQLAAWYATFERNVAQYLLDLPTPLERWIDPRIQARVLSMPGKLEKAGAILALPPELCKDPKGDDLMDIFHDPYRRGGEETLFGIRPDEWHDWEDRPAEWLQFVEYCRQDVVSERAIMKAMKAFPLPELDQLGWRLDQKINSAGMPVDLSLVRGALEIAVQDKGLQLDKIQALSSVKNPNSNPQILKWIKTQGYTFNGLGKAFVARALDGECQLTDACREVLETRKAASKTSYMKYQTILEQVGADGRLRHQFAYMGAARTGRWASYGVQLTNLPRPIKAVEKQMDLAVELLRAQDVMEIGYVFDDPMAVATSCVRAAFKAPPDKKLVVCDLNAIENRVIGWVANCDAILKVFRDGLDPYVAFGVHLYSIPYNVLILDKERRQQAKPAVLGCGYRLSGGEEALDKDGNLIKTGLWGYAAAMGVDISREESHRAVAIFREEYKEVVRCWYNMENAAFAALKGGIHRVGPVEFQAFGREPNGKDRKLLRMLLPSGRGLYYIRPRVDEKEWYGKMKDGLSYEGIDQVTKQWSRVDTHGGKLVENAVQAIARDLLLHGMLLADKMGFELIGSCHDEIIALTDADSSLGLGDLRTCMVTAPDWAESLPLGAEGYEAVGGYYHK